MQHLAEMLVEFTTVLFRFDPMNLGSSNPLEYDKEALSILSRFVESGVHKADYVEALKIVIQTFKFWFEKDSSPEQLAKLGELATELYDLMKKRYVLVDISETLG
jgi:hypothetical protein